jgi:hypothetical protein
MLHTNNPIIKHKAGLLNLAEELGNVSKACKVMGVSLETNIESFILWFSCVIMGKTQS